MTVSVANLTSLLLQLLCLPVEPAEHRNRSRWIALDRVEPERMCFSSAGELGERPGAVRSAGNRTREVRVRRSDRGVLLYAYFLLDKVAMRILRSRDIRTSLYSTRKYADRGSGTAFTIYYTLDKIARSAIQSTANRAEGAISHFNTSLASACSTNMSTSASNSNRSAAS